MAGPNAGQCQRIFHTIIDERTLMADDQFTTHADLFDLTGKYALVTGGTRGIGMMIARGLLQAGARVVVSSRKADACAEAQRTAVRIR